MGLCAVVNPSHLDQWQFEVNSGILCSPTGCGRISDLPAARERY
jgi:hypothetical protein